jgi:hypothetical protein
VYVAIALAVTIMGWSVNLRTADHHSSPEASRIPRRTNVCLITNNVNLLVEFYEPILGLKAQRAGEGDAEFHTGLGVLAIFSAAAQGKYIHGSADPGRNQSAIPEFAIVDFDKE